MSGKERVRTETLPHVNFHTLKMHMKYGHYGKRE